MVQYGEITPLAASNPRPHLFKFSNPVAFIRQAYLERQKRGPDLARLRCSAAADDLVKEMLAYEEPTRWATPDG